VPVRLPRPRPQPVHVQGLPDALAAQRPRCAIKAGVLAKEDRFTFHDLRAYYVTLHKRNTGKLPDIHKNPSTTALFMTGIRRSRAQQTDG
jgi:hypothetical protein